MLNKAVINLNYLQQNAREIKKLLPSKTKFCAVVKADAYGHGAVECANALYKLADCFAVALVEEGVKLRYGGIDKEVLVLIAPIKSDVERALEFDLSLTVESLECAKQIVSTAKKVKKQAKIHLKYNTGMNRQGLETIQQLLETLEYINMHEKEIKLQGFYSHFSAPQNKKELNCALNKFLLAKSIVKGYNNNVICHISASGGLLAGVYEDMVRVGIMLYGYAPFSTDRVKLKKVMRVYAPVLSVKKINRGELCLYGDKRLKRSRRCFLVRFGYADGLPRKRVKGQINNRCMDVSCIEYSSMHKSEKTYCVMSDAQALAKKYNTISYEVLTKITIRTEKFYKR